MASRKLRIILLVGLFLLSFNAPVLEALTCSTAQLPFRPIVQFLLYIVDEFLLILMRFYPTICGNYATSDFFDSPAFTGQPVRYPYNPYQLSHNLTIDEIRYYNWFAAAAYCNYRVSNKYPLNCCFCNHFSRPIIYKKVYYNFTRNTKVLVTMHSAKKEAVFSFRGTQIQNEVQVLLDFRQDFEHISVPGFSNIDVGVHNGFNDCTESLYKYVLPEVYRIRLNYPDYRIVFVGHSLGAAMATLSMFKVGLQAVVDQENYNNTLDGGTYVLVTYGGPRVGNNGFASLMNSFPITVQRVVNKADVVPHFIKVSNFAAGRLYFHSGQEVWIHDGASPSDTDQVKYCSRASWEDTTCSMSLAPKYTLSDHVFILDVDYSQCLILEDLGLGVLPLNLYGVMLNAIQKPRLEGAVAKNNMCGKNDNDDPVVFENGMSLVQDYQYIMDDLGLKNVSNSAVSNITSLH